ncbi:MAG: alpha-2,8-polysialyltransferase family protein [Bacteroidales bacterium]|jgi:hypothetical protein|nr:alpha-2,8-polysialyltransferase family protein [Bacteroidales bacterium]
MNTNIYIANTPFHLFVINTIIDNYYSNENKYRNIVVSTVSNGFYDNIKSSEVKRINRGLLSIRDIRKVKRIILKGENMHFFVPHLSNLFSSYFYHLSCNNKGNISVYYEGIALLYPSQIKKLFFVNFRRRFIAFCSGIYYKYWETLYPAELCKNAVCYSPFNVKENRFRELRKISFNRLPKTSNTSNILILTSITTSNDSICKIIDEVKNLMDKNTKYIYIKPHYKNKNIEKSVTDIKEKLRMDQVILLSKSIPIELLIDNIDIKFIVSQHFSSALLNLSLFFDLKDIVVIEDIRNEYIKEIAVSYNIIQ